MAKNFNTRIAIVQYCQIIKCEQNVGLANILAIQRNWQVANKP